ncbi:MAG: protein kinase [Planctomycetes bacterium]|nr:protein kinase [Planctomycetota bacterium]
MPDCPPLNDLRAYHGDALASAERERVTRHLETCATCREALQTLGGRGILDDKTQLGFRTPPEGKSGQPAAEPHLARTKPPKSGPAAREKDTELARSLLQPPEEPDEIGRIGNFRVLRVLGSGGMGMVFEAEETMLKRPVALKVIRPDFADAEEGWQRLLREARAMAALKHDHIVTLYQAGREKETFFLAMELLHGETLEERSDGTKRIETREIVRVARETAMGLAALHKNGLLHRDLKPSNIWLEGPTQRVKILDLGLARSTQGANKSTLTEAGTIMGTPAFMSPEQARGETLDPRSDLFSLGAVMYCLCTGERPFSGDSLVAQLTSLAVDAQKPVRERNPEIPPALSNLVDRLLEKKPNARPPNAEAVVAKLDKIEARLGQPPTPLERAGGARVLLSAAAGLVLLGAVVWAWNRRHDAPSAAESGHIDDAGKGAGPPRRERETTPGDTTQANPRDLFAQFKKQAADAPEKVFCVTLPLMDEGLVYYPKETGKSHEFEVMSPPDAFITFRAMGEASPHAIGMHPMPNGPSVCVLKLGKQFESFSVFVTQNEGLHEAYSSMLFTVVGDGKVLWKSEPLTSPKQAQVCRVPVKGIQELRLELDCDGEPRGCHGLWFEPYVSK